MTDNMTINVLDKNNNHNRWIVESETENTYKVYADCDKRYITEIYKDKVYIQEKILNDVKKLVLVSEEIRNPFCTIELESYSKAEYGVIWLSR